MAIMTLIAKRKKENECSSRIQVDSVFCVQTMKSGSELGIPIGRGGINVREISKENQRSTTEHKLKKYG